MYRSLCQIVRLKELYFVPYHDLSKCLEWLAEIKIVIPSNWLQTSVTVSKANQMRATIIDRPKNSSPRRYLCFGLSTRKLFMQDMCMRCCVLMSHWYDIKSRAAFIQGAIGPALGGHARRRRSSHKVFTLTECVRHHAVFVPVTPESVNRASRQVP